MNKEELIDFLKKGNGIIVNSVVDANNVIIFMQENKLIEEYDKLMINGFPLPTTLYISDDAWFGISTDCFDRYIISFNKIKNILEDNYNEDILEEPKETNKYFLYYELVYRSNEVINKDCTIIEAEDLNDELLHMKKLEIESKFQYSTDEKRRNAHVVFVNIVKL